MIDIEAELKRLQKEKIDAEFSRAQCARSMKYYDWNQVIIGLSRKIEAIKNLLKPTHA